MSDDMADQPIDPLDLAAELTVAWLANPNTRVEADDVPAFLRAMHASISALAGPTGAGQGPGEAAQAPAEHTPAVSVRKSLSSPDHIISMIDGRPYRTLKRHLSTYGLTPDQYRARYGLKPDYPMVAPGYSASRRDMAHKLGLGRKPKQDAPEPEQASSAVEDQPRAEPQPRRKLKLPEPS